MTGDRTLAYLVGLVRELCKLPRETEWLEFKAHAVAAGLIVVEDTTVGTRARTYLPYWAAPRARPGEIA
jgi:hypothetical protein